jgi:hypothetical protein
MYDCCIDANPWQSPKSGIFKYSGTVRRSTEIENPQTNETVHSSVKNQAVISPDVMDILRTQQSVIPPLLPLEEHIKQGWQYNPAETRPRLSVGRAQTDSEMKSENQASKYLQRVVKAATGTVKSVATQGNRLAVNEDGSKEEDSAIPKDGLVRRWSKKILGKGDGTL